MPSESKTCLICNTPLSFHEAQTSKLCGNPQCQWKHANLPRHQACAVCGRPLAPRELAAKVCAAPECQRSRFEERWREQWQRERQESEAHRAALKEQARQLREVAIFELDRRGHLVRSIQAARARIDGDGRWQLDDAVIRRFEPGAPEAPVGFALGFSPALPAGCFGAVRVSAEIAGHGRLSLRRHGYSLSTFHKSIWYASSPSTRLSDSVCRSVAL